MRRDKQLLFVILAIVMTIFVKSACGEGPTAQVMWERTEQKCYPNYCKFVKVRDYGTTFAIGKTREGRYCFLTAGHVFRDHVRERVYIGLGKQWRECRVESVSDSGSLDLAVLTVDYEGELECHQLAEETPDRGPFFLRGFADKKFEESRTGLTQFHEDGILSIAHTPKDGQSGGPIVDTSGRCVGVIKGYRESGVGVGFHVGVVRPYVARTFGYVPSCSLPKRPVVVVPPPVTPLPPQPIDTTRLDALERRLAALERRFDTLSVPDVRSLEGRVEALETRRITVEAPVQILSPSGEVIDEDVYQLPDEPIKLRLITKKEE